MDQIKLSCQLLTVDATFLFTHFERKLSGDGPHELWDGPPGRQHGPHGRDG